MREILFRGKRLDNGEWVEGYVYGCHDGTYDICDYNKEFNIERYGYEVMPSTIGQCIGLIDANGKKIFEGDIVNIFYENKGTGVIEWDEDAAQFVIFADRLFVDFNNRWTAAIEIIGNIHDNPELLEE